MVSRWAFEALAVNQVKRNEFDKEYYVDNKRISISDYKTNYWLPKLISKLARIENALDKPEERDKMIENIALIKTEFKKDMLMQTIHLAG